MIRTLTGLLFVLLLFSGCATWGTPPPPPDLSSVAIATAGEPELDLDAKTTTRRVLVGTGTGMATGFVAGVLGTLGVGLAAAVPAMIVPPVAAGVMGIAIVASPFVGAAGAVVGGVAGAGTGAIVGGLPSAKAKRINAMLKDPESVRSFTRELGTAVRANVPEERQAERNGARTIVAVELTDVELTQYRSDNLAIKMKASAKYSWGHIQYAAHRRSQKKPSTAICTYEFETEQAHVDAFLADDDAFAAAFTAAVNGIARQVSNDVNANQVSTRNAGSSVLGVQAKKLPSGDYELALDSSRDAEARNSAACLEKLHSAK